MLPAKRRQTITNLVSENGGRSVDELSTQLDVSKATVRRDLRELEDEGLIERSHGGAVPITSVGREQTYQQKGIQNLSEKVTIAERAVEEMADGQVVFFDSGTTTMEVAKRVSMDRLALAVTNSPLVALELGTEDSGVKLTGGTLRGRTRALVGPTAEAFMERMQFDLLFLGANAIDGNGLMTPNEEEARMKGRMIECSERTVLVADHTKLGERSLVRFADLADIGVFVTDQTVDDAERKALADADVTVLLGGQ
jgi:DeoR/GlpR family transcriptional regulator of sugar metabolism